MVTNLKLLKEILPPCPSFFPGIYLVVGILNIFFNLYVLGQSHGPHHPPARFAALHAAGSALPRTGE